MQEPIPVIGDEELLISLSNVLHHHHHISTLPLKISTKIPQRNKKVKGNDQKKLSEMPTRSYKLKIEDPVESLWGILSFCLSLKK